MAKVADILRSFGGFCKNFVRADIVVVMSQCDTVLTRYWANVACSNPKFRMKIDFTM